MLIESNGEKKAVALAVSLRPGDGIAFRPEAPESLVRHVVKLKLLNSKTHQIDCIKTGRPDSHDSLLVVAALTPVDLKTDSSMT
jgi:hypothetical protein